VAETLSRKRPACRARSRVNTVDLPTPDGPERMINFAVGTTIIANCKLQIAK
jgi:hypothetical protein